MTDSNDTFLRVDQIVGDSKQGIPAILPISRSYFWRIVHEGRIPKPVKLGPPVSIWKESDIREACRVSPDNVKAARAR